MTPGSLTCTACSLLLSWSRAVLLTGDFISRYECCFHVQEYNINSVAETQALIESALAPKYEDGAVSLHVTALTIRQIGKTGSSQRTCHAWIFECLPSLFRATKLSGGHPVDSLRGVYLAWNVSPGHPGNGLQKAEIQAGLQAVVRPRYQSKQWANQTVIIYLVVPVGRVSLSLPNINKGHVDGQSGLYLPWHPH